MKKTILLSVIVLVSFISAALIGCDNRSQVEKDLDKAAAGVEEAASDLQKNLNQ